MSDLIIRVPFGGFYNSEAEGRIDSAIEQFFSDYDTGEPLDVPDELYSKLDFQPIFLKYCQLYLEAFNSQLNEDLDIDIKLKFEKLDSPREYNFTTDTLYAYISEDDMIKLWSVIPSEQMARTVESHFTSYDGFISFYSNDYYSEDWQKHINQLDHNELGMWLSAYEHYTLELQEWELFDADYAYEDFSNFIDNQLYDAGFVSPE